MAWTLATALFVGASAFRVKPKRRSQRAAQIDGIFAYAAPGIAEPALVNPRGGPCFPGVRWANVKLQWFGQEADTVTTITGVLGYRHPWMDFKLVDLKNDSKNQLYSCAQEGEEVGNRPRGLSKIALHDRGLYREATENMDLGWGDLLHKMANIGLPESYNLNRTRADQNARRFGWEVIGSAIDEGGANRYVGEQVSHLFQNQASKECMLTFQGSSSLPDWAANLNLKKVPFCGYAPENTLAAAEEHLHLASGQALVHEGFKDALMQIVKNDDWQSDVRPKLASCSKVYVTGHSLGAAQAQLFGACVQKAPGQGQDGYDDYRYMSW